MSLWGYAVRHRKNSALDFSRYEPLDGHRPYRVMAWHPTGRYVAMSIFCQREPMVAVWEEATGKMVWADKRAEALTWLKHGSEMVILTDRIGESSATYQGHTFERRAWPENTLISACKVSLPPWGEPVDILVSPHGNLALLRWLTQGASGWEFVLLSDASDLQLQGAGFEMDTPAAIYASPAFSPDGCYVVSGYHTRLVEDKRGGNIPLQRGRYEVGFITVVCIPDGTFHEIIIADAVPVKLHGAAQSLDEPVFLDNEHFMTMLPTGAKRAYSVRNHSSMPR